MNTLTYLGFFTKYAVFHKHKYVFVKYICPKGKYAHACLRGSVLKPDTILQFFKTTLKRF